jgi:hypothetical protein
MVGDKSQDIRRNLHTYVFRLGLISQGAVGQDMRETGHNDLHSSKQSYLHRNISSIGALGMEKNESNDKRSRP